MWPAYRRLWRGSLITQRYTRAARAEGVVHQGTRKIQLTENGRQELQGYVIASFLDSWSLFLNAAASGCLSGLPLPLVLT